MSKSALQGPVNGLARDLGPRGITINNVQPGAVDTEMNPAEGEFADMLKKLSERSYLSMTPAATSSSGMTIRGSSDRARPVCQILVDDMD